MILTALIYNLFWWMSCLMFGNPSARVLGGIGTLVTAIGLWGAK